MGQVTEDLRATHDLIMDERNWTTGAYCRTDIGAGGQVLLRKFCLVGAVRRVVIGDEQRDMDFLETEAERARIIAACEVLANIATYEGADEETDWADEDERAEWVLGTVIDWNDTRNYVTHPMVMDVCERSIKFADEAGL